MSFLKIDGSVLEGGGQTLRNSISLSAILGVPVHITNIRAGRKNPGLAPQHLKGIQLITKMSQGLVKGDSIGSTEIKFMPGRLRGGSYVVDTKTAGSTSLLLQVALPCALMADEQVRLDLIGGTNADMAPPIDYMDKVFKPMLQKFKGDFSLKIYKRGYFPRGGGHVTVHVDPVSYLHGADITEFGSILSIRGDSFVAGTLPMKLAYQMSDGARQELAHLPNVNIRVYKEDRNLAPDNCSGIMLSCETTSGCVLGGNALGRRGAEAHAVGVEAAAPLCAVIESTACLDQYAQDQAILYMAIAKGKSAIKCGEVTLHTKTAIYVAELIAKTKFTIQPEGDLNIIECTGLGYINRSVTSKQQVEVTPGFCR